MMPEMINTWAGTWGRPMCGTGMAFVGLIGLLVIVLLALAIIALVKYLLSRGSR